MTASIPSPTIAQNTGQRSWRRQELPVVALWMSSLVSIFGNMLTAIAVPWFILELTGSATKTSLVAAVTLIPVIVTSFVGGAVVDRTDYRWLSVLSDAMSAITVAAVPLLYLTTGLNFAGLLVLMLLGSVCDAPGATARNAMVPSLSRLTGVPLERINANFSMIAAMSSLFSAPLAGLLIAWLGPVHVLWFNAATFVLSGLAVLLFIPRLPRVEQSGNSIAADVRAGFAYVRAHATLRVLILGALMINFLFAPLFGVAIPYLANTELHSVKGLGVMFGGEGIGALLGSWLYGRLNHRLPRHTFLVAALILLALPLVPLAFAKEIWMATALIAVVGLGSGLVSPMVGTFLQRSTPEAFLGRVTGLVRGGSLVAQPAGILIGGPLIAMIGLTPLMAAIGCLMVGTAALLIASPDLRGLDDAVPAT